MKISYTPTLEDYKAVYRLHHSQKLGGRGGYTLLFIGLPIFAFLGLIFFMVLSFYGDKGPAKGFSGIEIFSVLCLCSLYLLVRRSYVIRKQLVRFIGRFQPSQSDKAKIIDIDDERIISEIAETSITKYFWTAICAYAQDDKITLIYVRHSGYIFIPARVMSHAQRAELNELVKRHLPEGKR
jgi:hypothetical protein